MTHSRHTIRDVKNHQNYILHPRETLVSDLTAGVLWCYIIHQLYKYIKQ